MSLFRMLVWTNEITIFVTTIGSKVNFLCCEFDGKYSLIGCSHWCVCMLRYVVYWIQLPVYGTFMSVSCILLPMNYLEKQYATGLDA